MKKSYPLPNNTVTLCLLSFFLFASPNVFSQATTTCSSTYTQCAGQQQTFTGGANGFTGTTGGFTYSNDALRVASTSPNTSYTITSPVYSVTVPNVVNVGFTTAGSTATIASYLVEVVNNTTGVVVASCANPTNPTVGPICYTVTDNDLTAGLPIYFRITITTGGGNRQTLVFDNFTFLQAQLSPLPVRFSDFSVTRKNNTVFVRWETAMEADNKAFDVQRKTSGSEFQTIATVPSQASGGNSLSKLTYEFTDPNSYGGNSFYRIRQVSTDNKATYSDIKMVRGENSTSTISTYPNPVHNTLTLEGAKSLRIRIVDVNGRPVIEKTISDDVATVDVAKLPAGLYTIQFSNQQQIVQQVKLVKN